MKGESRTDYFHFLCDCGGAMEVHYLGRDPSVPTVPMIRGKCGTCGRKESKKLHNVYAFPSDPDGPTDPEEIVFLDEGGLT